MQSCKLGKSFRSCNPSKYPAVKSNANDNFESCNDYWIVIVNKVIIEKNLYIL